MQSAHTELGVYFTRGEARNLFAEIEHVTQNLGLHNLPGLRVLQEHIDRAGMSGTIPVAEPLPQRVPQAQYTPPPVSDVPLPAPPSGSTFQLSPSFAPLDTETGKASS